MPESFISHENAVNIIHKNDFRIEVHPLQTEISDVPSKVRQNPVINYFTWYNPFLIMFMSMILSWTYLLIPKINYWVYTCVKTQLWTTMGIFVYCEIMECALPDASDRNYILAYVFGYLGSVILYVLVWLSDAENNPSSYILAPTLPILAAAIFYGIDVAFGNKNEKNEAVNMRITTLHDTIIASNARQSSMYTQNSNSLSVGVKVNRITIQTNDQAADINSSACAPLSSCNLWGFLPRFMYRRSCLAEPVALGERFQVYWMALLFEVLFNLNYYFLTYFTQEFVKYAVTDTIVLIMFCIYVFVTTFLRVIMKRLGVEIDRRTKDSFSMFFFAEFMALLFYYTFYRILFSAVDTWDVFLIFEVIHLSSEWLLYPCRASVYFFNVMMSWKSSKNGIIQSIGSFMCLYDLTIDDWRHFVALDFGIRCVILVMSGIEAILFFVTISSSLVPDIGGLTESQLRTTLQFLGVSLIFEIVNAIFINSMFFARHDLDIAFSVMTCFSNPRFAVPCLFLTVCLFNNPMGAFVNTAITFSDDTSN